MRNVIVFATEWGRFAVELRWVREVVTLGHVTPVPGAPIHIAGAVNVRGTITPVIDVGMLREPGERPGKRADERASSQAGEAGQPVRAGRDASRGDGAVLLDVEELALALRIIKVDEVATVGDGGLLPSGTCGGAASLSVIDSRREPVPLIEPPELVRISLSAAHALAAGDPMSGFRAGHNRHGRTSGRISTEPAGLEFASDGDELFR